MNCPDLKMYFLSKSTLIMKLPWISSNPNVGFIVNEFHFSSGSLTFRGFLSQLFKLPNYQENQKTTVK